MKIVLSYVKRCFNVYLFSFSICVAIQMSCSDLRTRTYVFCDSSFNSYTFMGFYSFFDFKNQFKIHDFNEFRGVCDNPLTNLIDNEIIDHTCRVFIVFTSSINL